ncbi:MAG: TlpA family protein disulfide reductase [Gammaproteobacteria bacterium]|nr:TlpA family protein disulfide reductase [Gammaproteobacteria bacterium]
MALIVTGLGLKVLITGDTNQTVPPAENLTIQTDVLFESIEGTYRPDFSLPDIQGRLRSIAEWNGKVVLVNFWATWCLPCLTEIPELLDLQEQYGEQGLQVIGIALQKPEELIGFVAEQNMTYPVMAGEAEVIVIAESFGNHIGALPYTAIIDRTGIVAFTKAGPISKIEVEGLIADLLM